MQKNIMMKMEHQLNHESIFSQSNDKYELVSINGRVYLASGLLILKFFQTGVILSRRIMDILKKYGLRAILLLA
jgi:hypothetical protein